MNGSAYNLTTPRGSVAQMQGAVRLLEALGKKRTPYVLSQNEIAGLEENARLVAVKYWATKGTGRTVQSVQNQLNLGRWYYMDQAPYAEDVILEIAADAGLTLAFYP